MFCEKCGRENPEGSKFCEYCGAEIAEPASMQQRPVDTPQFHADQSAPQQQNTGRKNTVIIAVAAMALVVIAAVLVFAFVINGDDDTGDDTGSSFYTGEDSDSDDYTYGTYDDDDGYYILPNSDTEYVTSADLWSLSDRELMLARNEIYARNGRKFDDADIRSYFEAQSWYRGTIDPDDFTEDMLNSVEKTNVEEIKKEEERR